MLLQTNSYIVPRDKRVEHARLLRRFRQTLHRLGCDHFEVFEQVGANWKAGEPTNRFVQIMRFRDRRHQLEVQNAERSDPVAQQLVQEFCELINFNYQQQQGLFAVGFYNSFMKMPTPRPMPTDPTAVGDPTAPSPSAALHEHSEDDDDSLPLEEPVFESTVVETMDLADEPSQTPQTEGELLRDDQNDSDANDLENDAIKPSVKSADNELDDFALEGIPEEPSHDHSNAAPHSNGASANGIASDSGHSKSGDAVESADPDLLERTGDSGEVDLNQPDSDDSLSDLDLLLSDDPADESTDEPSNHSASDSTRSTHGR